MPGSFAAIHWNKGMLTLLDQRKLPHEIVYLDYDDCHVVAHAITDMAVRGAPAISIAAAYAVVLAARRAYRVKRRRIGSIRLKPVWKYLPPCDRLLLIYNGPLPRCDAALQRLIQIRNRIFWNRQSVFTIRTSKPIGPSDVLVRH